MQATASRSITQRRAAHVALLPLKLNTNKRAPFAKTLRIVRALHDGIKGHGI